MLYLCKTTSKTIRGSVRTRVGFDDRFGLGKQGHGRRNRFAVNAVFSRYKGLPHSAEEKLELFIFFVSSLS